MEKQKQISLLNKIKVFPLAAESFGVRSMCTMVETPDISVLLDAGISLCPYRFSLPPHPVEFQTIAKLRRKIAEAADKADVVTISHYHFDHHTPSYEDWVVGFSEAVAHGNEDLMLGWVIMATIECGIKRFMFAPDVQGPMSSHTLELVLKEAPTAIMLGGPPFYLGGFRVELAQLERGLRNLERIVEAVPLVILEHHALRDESWKQKIAQVYEKAFKEGHSVVTAAEYMGNENCFLESKRKQLFRDSPPSTEFKQWMKTLNNKKIAKPPI